MKKSPAKKAVAFNPKAITELVQNLAKYHPEHATLIEAFSALTIAREQLLHDYALKRKPATTGTKPAILLANIPLCPTKCAAIAQEVIKALGKGFKDIKSDLNLISKQFTATPSTVRRLTKECLSGENQALQSFALKHKVAENVLSLVIVQVSQIMTAIVTKAIPEIINPEVNDTCCPYCGSRPYLSVISTVDGRRDLLCSHCGQTWRFSRSTCPLCTTDVPKNLHHIYKENSPTERAVYCENCQHYILEKDIRNSSLSPAQCQPVALTLGYLDVLAQEEGYTPLSSIPSNSNIHIATDIKGKVQ